MPLLQKIKIISARGAYEAKFPNDSRRWKHEAFLDMQKKFNSELVTNILCLGDSFIEIEAGHFLAARASWSMLSARYLILHDLQSTSGSEKFATCPDASHTRGCIKIAASSPTILS